MAFKLLGGGSDLPTVISDVNTNILELKNQEVTKIIKDDDGTRVAILDKNGLRTTAPGSGIDVVTAADDQLTFNSAQNTFKVAATLTGSVALSFSARAAAGSDGTFREFSTNSLALPHGLLTVPAIFPFFYDSTSGIYVPITNGSLLNGGAAWSTTNPQTAFQGTTVGSMATLYWSISITNTTVTIQAYRSGWARTGVTVASVTLPSLDLKVYCLQETAN